MSGKQSLLRKVILPAVFTGLTLLTLSCFREDFFKKKGIPKEYLNYDKTNSDGSFTMNVTKYITHQEM